MIIHHKIHKVIMQKSTVIVPLEYCTVSLVRILYCFVLIGIHLYLLIYLMFNILYYILFLSLSTSPFYN